MFRSFAGRELPLPARPSRWRTSFSRAGWRRPASTQPRRFWNRSGTWLGSRGVREHRPYRGSVHRLAGGDPLLLRAGRTAFHHADRVQTDYARRLRLDPVCTLEQDLVPRGKGAGNVVSSGIKVLVLAVIVGIGSGLFAEFQVHPDEPSIDHALVVMLASLALLALGIFGPGIATGRCPVRHSWCGRDGWCCGRGCRHRRCHRRRRNGRGRRRHGRARMAPAAAKLAGAGARAATSAAGSARSAFQAGSAAAGGGAKGAAAGLGNVAKTGAQAAGRSVTSGASAVGQKVADSFRAGWNGTEAGSDGAGPGQTADGTAGSQKQQQPAGPSGCTAASRLPMPRPLPPTRCAAATAAAPGKARACGIPIPNLQGEHPCDSNDRRCATPIRRSLPPVSSRRPGVGRPYRLRPRAGEELAPDGLRLPSARAVDGRRRCGARRSPS